MYIHMEQIVVWGCSMYYRFMLFMLLACVIAFMAPWFSALVSKEYGTVVLSIWWAFVLYGGSYFGAKVTLAIFSKFDRNS